MHEVDVTARQPGEFQQSVPRALCSARPKLLKEAGSPQGRAAPARALARRRGTPSRGEAGVAALGRSLWRSGGRFGGRARGCSISLWVPSYFRDGPKTSATQCRAKRNGVVASSMEILRYRKRLPRVITAPQNYGEEVPKRMLERILTKCPNRLFEMQQSNKN